MVNDLFSILVLSIPEAILILALCMSFLNKRFNFNEFLIYCMVMGAYLYFLVPLINIHLYYIISYTFINIMLLKLIFKVNIFDSLIAYSISFAIYFAVENVFVQVELKLLRLSPDEFLKTSFSRIVSFYTLAIIIYIIVLLVRRKRILLSNDSNMD